MKKIVCCCLFIFCIFSLFCFEKNQMGIGDELSVEYICSGLAENPNIVGDFTQIKTIKSNGRKLKSTGRFIICPEGIVWETKKPFASCVIFTERKMIQIANNGRVSVMDGKDNLMFENISSTMIAVFAGNAGELKNNFEVNLSCDSDKKSWNLQLVPKDDTIKTVMEKLILKGKFNESIVSLDSLEMNESSGNTIQYLFSNQAYPKELSADEKEYFSIK